MKSIIGILHIAIVIGVNVICYFGIRLQPDDSVAPIIRSICVLIAAVFLWAVLKFQQLEKKNEQK